MAVYDRATRAILPEEQYEVYADFYLLPILLDILCAEKINVSSRHFYFNNFLFQMFNIYIKRAAEIYGVTHTRAIYEKAIEVLPDEQARYIDNDVKM